MIQMNPMIPWAIYVALQVVIRRSQHKFIPSQDTSIPNSNSSATLYMPRRNASPTVSRRAGELSKANSYDQPDESLNDARALDSMHALLSTLIDMKVYNPLARVLEEQINTEMAEGEALTRERAVGLVDFPLTHPSTRSPWDGTSSEAFFQM